MVEDKRLEDILNRLETLEQKFNCLEKKINQDNNTILNSNLLHSEVTSHTSTENNSDDSISFAALKNPANLISSLDFQETDLPSLGSLEKETSDIFQIGNLPSTQSVVNSSSGFTSAHLVLLVSCLSSIILFTLGIFFIAK